MPQNHDAFLESKCAEEEAKGRQPSVINLIAALREHAPMGLKEAKDTVDDFLRRRGHSASSLPAVQDYHAWLREHIAQLESRAEKPNRINLIKDLRERANLGLKETKDIVDEFCNRERPDIPTYSRPGLLNSVAKMLGLE